MGMVGFNVWAMHHSIAFAELLTAKVNLVNQPSYPLSRAAAYIKLQEHQKALQDCDIAIAKNPNYARAYARKG